MHIKAKYIYCKGDKEEAVTIITITTNGLKEVGHQHIVHFVDKDGNIRCGEFDQFKVDMSRFNE